MKVEKEISKIIEFIKSYVEDDEKIVIPVSGGLDSDVVTRLCYKALGRDRIKIFIVKEDNLEPKFIENARNLAIDLNVKLTEIPLYGKSAELVQNLSKADTDNIFNSNSILEIGKAKCAIRSSIISCYQDKGYIIAGSTNRTEYELGFFVTFGDNLANFKPIEHLYKSEVIEIAKTLGTRKEVINQSPSAGFWEKQEDLEDISYWIVNKGPILRERTFTDEEISRAEEIKGILNWSGLDTCLKMIRENQGIEDIVENTKLPEDVILDIKEVIRKAKKYKNREILKSLR